ncbi:hypothetical protein DL98DRAFT_620461 [Cadophora sp. DSE1049]|nr:hypothetical protein DL98DRAFT_620461 [Cadophora sp. DSE1049]
MPTLGSDMARTSSTKKDIHEMTDEDLARLNETVLRAKKAKIDKALLELRQKFEETKLVIDRELVNSNTSTPASLNIVGKAIQGIDLTNAWSRHEAEMLKPKAEREQDHWNNLRKFRSSDFYNNPAIICEAMKADPGRVLTIPQMRVLKEHFDGEDCKYAQD